MSSTEYPSFLRSVFSLSSSISVLFFSKNIGWRFCWNAILTAAAPVKETVGSPEIP